MCEESSSNDEMVGMVQLEEQCVSGDQGSKCPTGTRLPEIDFLDPGLSAEKSEPIPVGYSYESLHTPFDTSTEPVASSIGSGKGFTPDARSACSV